MFQDEPPAQSSKTQASKQNPKARARETHACLIRLKVVPASRKNEIVGPLGDRLKVKVSAPPEDGKANLAVCALLGEALGVEAGRVEILAGATRAEKTARVLGMSAACARSTILHKDG